MSSSADQCFIMSNWLLTSVELLCIFLGRQLFSASPYRCWLVFNFITPQVHAQAGGYMIGVGVHLYVLRM